MKPQLHSSSQIQIKNKNSDQTSISAFVLSLCLPPVDVLFPCPPCFSQDPSPFFSVTLTNFRSVSRCSRRILSTQSERPFDGLSIRAKITSFRRFLAKSWSFDAPAFCRAFLQGHHCFFCVQAPVLISQRVFRSRRSQ